MNRLADEKSPYLRQHAGHPVEWYPWGDDAFARAADENKPIFLSVGYSTCHWCHVMAHESFEDPETAALLAESFVSVKVDREERPDVDQVYMVAVQAMTGQGGWPMTVFLTPAGDPFYAGTYFPPEDRYGRPGFPTLLAGIRDAWATRQDALVAQGARVMSSIQSLRLGSEGGERPVSAIATCVSELKHSFDRRYGGFGSAPKFPRPMVFSLLLRWAERRKDTQALQMVRYTLERMSRGGIRDHLGGGFSRYSVDERWEVPHFEKMLYDNAQLVRTLVELSLVTGESVWGEVVHDTLTYVRRDLQAPDGGFYAAEDADSEGREGAFYVWTPAALKAALPAEDVALAAYRFGVTPEGNFEGRGESVLSLARTLEEAARRFDHPVDVIRARLEAIRARLFAVRASRPRPGRDEKILTAWNGLMIGAMARAYRALGDESYRESALAAARFIDEELRDEAGRLLRRWCDGEARFSAYLDDHMLLADGLLDLYESTGEMRWYHVAVSLGEEVLSRFWDAGTGGFFYTSDQHDPFLKARIKDAHDGALPSGNSVAVHVLRRLYAFSGDRRWLHHADKTIEAFTGRLESAAQAYPCMLAGLQDLESPLRQIVVVGKADASDTRALMQVIWSRYLPGAVSALVAPGASDRPPVARDRGQVDGQATAYVCEGFTCRLPVTTPEALAGLLDDG